MTMAKSPENTRVALISDIHFGARVNNEIFLKHFALFFDTVFFPYLDEQKITTVLLAGDFFDQRKTINLRTLSYINKHFVAPATERKLDIHFVLGNHDTFFKSTNDLNSPSEIFQNSDVVKIYEEPTEIDVHGSKLLMLPWINKANEEESLKAIKDSNAEYLIGHLDLNGFYLNSGMTQSHGIDPSVFSKFQKVFTGHYHKKQDNGKIYYLGSPYQITWADYQEEKGFYDFDLKDNVLKFVKNPYWMFDKIFYDEETIDVDKFEVDHLKSKYIRLIITAAKDRIKLDRFIDRVYDADPANLSLIEEIPDYSGDGTTEGKMNLEMDTGTLIEGYIDAEIHDPSIDKDALKKFMRELHADAISKKSYVA